MKLMLREKAPLLVSLFGVAVGFINFAVAYFVGKSEIGELVFDVAFVVTAIGVFWGFLRSLRRES